MPIQFSCDQCGKSLKVRDELAGKRVKCPQCQNVLTVPAGEAASKAAEKAAGEPSEKAAAGATGQAAGDAGQWYLQTEDGETYGPVPRGELDEWAAEGRITASCQVLREGDEQWQWATEVYPQLASAGTPAESESPQPSPTPAADQPKAPSAQPEAATSPASGSGGFDFSALGAAEPKQSGPADFAPSETEGAAPVPFDFGGDAGRGRRGGKSSKAAAPTVAPSEKPEAAPADQPGYPAGVQPAYSSPKLTGRMQRLKRVGVLSFGKFMGATGALMGLVIGIPYGLISILVGLAGFASEGGAGFGAMGIGMGLLMMVLFPVFYGALSFVFGLIYALIINLVLGFIGGLEMEFEA